MPQNTSSLYQRALGTEFDRLPLSLRQFHTRSEGHAQGSLSVRRGSGRLRNFLADCLRLPCAGERLPIRLQVKPWGEGERWVRHFGELRLETRQWLWQRLLVEAAGPLQFGFRLRADADALRFDFLRAWLWGIPLPRLLSPRVAAIATGTEQGWTICVRVDFPLLGTLVEYQGEVAPV